MRKRNSSEELTTRLEKASLGWILKVVAAPAVTVADDETRAECSAWTRPSETMIPVTGVPERGVAEKVTAT